MGRHRRNDNNDGNVSRDVIRKVLEFDAEDARLNAKYEEKRAQMGPVERATADAEMNRKSWGLRKR